jgi:cell division protein FtsB
MSIRIQQLLLAIKEKIQKSRKLVEENKTVTREIGGLNQELNAVKEDEAAKRKTGSSS